MTVGLSPEFPAKYLGPNVYLVTVVTRNREPTGADYRQPETGKLYPINTFWQVSKNPTTGVEGEIWVLTKIVANVAYWQIVGSGSAGPIVNINVDASTPPGTDPVVPSGLGTITITGSQVAAGTIANVIRTNSLAVNSFTIEIQRSSEAAAADEELNGVCHFNSAHFNVDADGFVSLAGGGAAIDTITGNSGGAVSPDSNGNINVIGSGNITVVGTPVNNTETISLTGLTNHAVQVATGVNTLTQVGPDASTHSIFMGQGVSADPAFLTNGTPYVAGISFDAGANVLQNYVGLTSFTPTITGSGSNPTVGYTTQLGRYTRIGNLIYFSITLVVTLTGGTGSILISNLPFASNSTANLFHFFTGLTFDGTNYLRSVFQLNASGTSMFVFPIDTTGNMAIQLPLNTYTQFFVTGFYSV